jgi:hypothetical protein
METRSLHIDVLPDEILSRIFTLGCDSGSQQVFRPIGTAGEPILKPFARTLQAVCWRWRQLVLAAGNKHLRFSNAWMRLPPFRDVDSVSLRLKPPTGADRELTTFLHTLDHSDGADLCVHMHISDVHPPFDQIQAEHLSFNLLAAELSMLNSYAAHGLRRLARFAPRIQYMTLMYYDAYHFSGITHLLESLGHTPRLATLTIHTLSHSFSNDSSIPRSAKLLGYFKTKDVAPPSKKVLPRVQISEFSFSASYPSQWIALGSHLLQHYIDAVGQCSLNFIGVSGATDLQADLDTYLHSLPNITGLSLELDGILPRNFTVPSGMHFLQSLSLTMEMHSWEECILGLMGFHQLSHRLTTLSIEARCEVPRAYGDGVDLRTVRIVELPRLSKLKVVGAVSLLCKLMVSQHLVIPLLNELHICSTPEPDENFAEVHPQDIVRQDFEGWRSREVTLKVTQLDHVDLIMERVDKTAVEMLEVLRQPRFGRATPRSHGSGGYILPKVTHLTLADADAWMLSESEKLGTSQELWGFLASLSIPNPLSSLSLFHLHGLISEYIELIPGLVDIFEGIRKFTITLLAEKDASSLVYFRSVEQLTLKKLGLDILRSLTLYLQGDAFPQLKTVDITLIKSWNDFYKGNYTQIDIPSERAKWRRETDDIINDIVSARKTRGIQALRISYRLASNQDLWENYSM